MPSTDGPDTDFMVKLVDVYPDGYEAIVLDAPIRARYRNGRMPDDVKMMTPNVPEKLTIDLWETAITFEPGHKIAVHVASTGIDQVSRSIPTPANCSDTNRRWLRAWPRTQFFSIKIIRQRSCCR